MAIKIVLDSMVDMPIEMKEKFEFIVLPIPIVIGEKEYLDGVNISPEEVLGKGGKDCFPKTSQIRQLDYYQCFKDILENGDEFIYISLSSGLSGTYQTAVLVSRTLKEDYPNAKYAIVDSKTATIGMALMAYQAVKMIDAGYNFEKVTEVMEFMAENIQIVFMISDLEWLHKGGRASRSSAFVGDKLNIKPILHIPDGSITVGKKARGNKKAIKIIAEMAKDICQDSQDQVFGIVQFDSENEAMILKKVLEKQFKTDVNMFVDGIGSALTVHLGASGLGLVFLKNIPDVYFKEYSLDPKELMNINQRMNDEKSKSKKEEKK